MDICKISSPSIVYRKWVSLFFLTFSNNWLSNSSANSLLDLFWFLIVPPEHFLLNKVINNIEARLHWCQSHFGFLANIECFITKEFISNCSSTLIWKISRSQVMSKQASFNSFWKKIFWISCLFIYFYSFIFLVSVWQAFYVNGSCFKCISCINFCPANKELFIVSFILCF